MRVENRYIVKVNREKFLCFYIKNNTIFIKEIIGGSVSSEKIIAKDVRESYTVTLCKNRMIYLFCQTLSGDIMHFKIKDGKWSENVILKNNGKNSKNILFYCIENGPQMSLIYNIPTVGLPNSVNSFDIMKQTFDGKENWSIPEKIDSILSMNDFIFQIYIINPGYGVIFYQKNNKNTENNIGYREFNIDRIGNYNSVYSTNYRIASASFLPAKNGIHFIFAVKNIFSTRIIYRKKGVEGMEDYIVLSETNQVESCEISIANGNIYAFWKNPMGIFYCTSKDNGRTFTKPYKYSKKITGILKKAAYLSYEEMSEDKFYVNNLYTDNNDIWDIKILPEICDNFIAENNNKSIENKPSDVTNYTKNGNNGNTINTPNKEINMIEEYKKSVNIANDSNAHSIEMLKNQIIMLNEQLAFKNKQIEHLTASLQRKNEEIMLNEKVWHKKYNTAVNSIIEKNKQIEKPVSENTVTVEEKNDNIISEQITENEISNFDNTDNSDTSDNIQK